MQYGEFAEIYDSLMYDIDYKAWADYIFTKIPARASVAEIGCGTGNLTAYLARLASVTAVDCSEEMLRIASEKLRKKGLRVNLTCGSAQSFRLHKPSDAVICACDVINYITSPDEVRAAFKNISAMLKPNGRFLFDISSENKLKNMAGELYSEDNDEVTYIWRNSEIKPDKTVEMDISFFVNAGGDNYRRFDETHIQRAHSREEIEQWLAEAGFGAISVGDDYTDNKINENTWRITFCAEKIR